MVGPFGQDKANAICMENTASLDFKQHSINQFAT